MYKANGKLIWIFYNLGPTCDLLDDPVVWKPFRKFHRNRVSRQCGSFRVWVNCSSWWIVDCKICRWIASWASDREVSWWERMQGAALEERNEWDEVIHDDGETTVFGDNNPWRPRVRPSSNDPKKRHDKVVVAIVDDDAEADEVEDFSSILVLRYPDVVDQFPKRGECVEASKAPSSYPYCTNITIVL